MAKILVVEDEIIIAKQLEDHLTGLGYKVVGRAENGKDSLRLAKRLRPDLILMDIVMPGPMDGIDASRQIISELDIPVIFITAHTDDTLVERASTSEASGYIVKPFGEGEIKASVELALSRKQKERQLRESEQQYHALISEAGDAILLAETSGKIVDVNKMAEKLLGYSKEELLTMDYQAIYSAEEQGKVSRALKEIIRKGIVFLKDVSILKKDGLESPIELTGKLIHLGSRRVVQAIFRDISDHRNEELERLKLIQKLEKRLKIAQSKQGLITICGGCKSIRDEAGRWHPVEHYIRKHLQVELSHSLCPECSKKCSSELDAI